MEPRDGGLARLKQLADVAGRKVAETTKSASQRVVDGAGDAQEMAKHATGQAMELTETAGRKASDTARAASRRATEVAGDAQHAARRTVASAMAKAAEVADAMPSWVPHKPTDLVDLSQLRGSLSRSQPTTTRSV